MTKIYFCHKEKEIKIESFLTYDDSAHPRI